MGCFLVGFVPLCRPAAIGAGSAAELSRFGVFPECQKLLPADGTDCRPGGLPVLRLGVSVLPLESAPVRAELLRSASLRLDNRHSTVRAKAGRHSFQIFLRCCRVQWALPPSSVRFCMKKATPKSRLSFSCCEFINFSGIQWVLRKHHRCVGRHSHRFPSAPSEKMGHSSCRYLSFSPESLSSLHLHR